MSFFSDIPLQTMKADQVEAQMAAGGNVPPGVYRAHLETAKEVISKEKGTPGFELKFQIEGGMFNGCSVTDTLWKTDNERLRNRIVLFGLRLGILTRDPKTQEVTPVEGKVDFTDAIDTKCIVEVVEETFKRDDGSQGKNARIAYGGVYYTDDKKAAEKIGKPATSTSGTGGTGGTGNASKAIPSTADKDKAAANTSAAKNGKLDVSKL